MRNLNVMFNYSKGCNKKIWLRHGAKLSQCVTPLITRCLFCIGTFGYSAIVVRCNNHAAQVTHHERRLDVWLLIPEVD